MTAPSELPEIARALFDSAEFATLATIEPDGRPHLSVVWVSRDGDDVLVSTVEGRRKHRNLERDPRCTVLVFPRESPYTYVEVRGTASLSYEGGRELIDEHSRKYRGLDRYPGDDGTANVRVVVRITPDKVVEY
jgi:PPOX class probable F420-dependent enzyme